MSDRPCKKCGTTKRYTQGQCVKCFSINHKNYYDTPKGRASKMWTLLVTRVENKNNSVRNACYSNVKILLTREEFIRWAIPELELWSVSNPIEEASLDRIDSKKDYELGNLQILTKSENTLKRDRNKNVTAPEGMAWCGRCQKYLEKIYFGRNKQSFNGLNCYCKKHQKEISRKKYEASLGKLGKNRKGWKSWK